jgi:hypothetical protein
MCLIINEGNWWRSRVFHWAGSYAQLLLNLLYLQKFGCVLVSRKAWDEGISSSNVFLMETTA